MKNFNILIKTIFIGLLLFITGCSSVDKKQWNTSLTTLIQRQELKKGDILILNKQFGPYSLFGHSAMMVDDGLVGEYPAYGYDYIERDIVLWLYDNYKRKIIVLRPKDLTNEELRLFDASIDNYRFGRYSVFAKKDSNEKFYCSSWIYKVYLDLGIDLVDSFGFFVYPYDFLKSPQLTQLEFHTIYTKENYEVRYLGGS